MKAPIAFTLAALTLAAAPARAIVGESADGAAHADETVMVLSRDAQGSGFCTGIVLTPRVILTAAHCLRAPSDMLVHFRDADGAPVVVEVLAKLAHPDYRADAAPAPRTLDRRRAVGDQDRAAVRVFTRQSSAKASRRRPATP